MPYRRFPLVNGEIYHVFNRSIAKQQIFHNYYDYDRIIQLVNYYRFSKLPLRFSFYKRLPKEIKEEFTKKYLIKNVPMLDIIAYCIMPNHFHFLLKPNKQNAISDFMRNIQNGYSKYYNLKYNRTGSLFQFMFKAVHIERDEQLLHVCRYIHLNPITAHIVTEHDFENYIWSSLNYYLSTSNNDSFINSAEVMANFKSIMDFRNFMLDQIEYQRELNKIKHLVFK